VARPGVQRRNSEAGAEESQQGVLSTVAITRMWAAAASPTIRSASASWPGSIEPCARGSSADQGSSTRTTPACSACAVAIAPSILAAVVPEARPVTLTPPRGAAVALEALRVHTASTARSGRRWRMFYTVGCWVVMSPTWIWMQAAIVVFVLIGMAIAIVKLA
jgi:hypothetical protein